LRYLKRWEVTGVGRKKRLEELEGKVKFLKTERKKGRAAGAAKTNNIRGKNNGL
jgi:hypothetical protein